MIEPACDPRGGGHRGVGGLVLLALANCVDLPILGRPFSMPESGGVSLRSRQLLIFAMPVMLVLTACTAEDAVSSSSQPKPPLDVSSDAAVSLVQAWVEAAVAGDYDAARALTYDPDLGDQGLDGAVDAITDYNSRLGDPVVWVADEVHPSSHDALTFVCLSITYPGFTFEGAIVLRDWEELGLRVWEYRRMEGCLSTTSTTVAP